MVLRRQGEKIQKRLQRRLFRRGPRGDACGARFNRPGGCECKVVEKPMGNLGAGVGFSQSQGAIFNASIAQNNFLGNRQANHCRGEYQQRKYSLFIGIHLIPIIQLMVSAEAST